MGTDRFPIVIREQPIQVRIYRQKPHSTASGFSYVVAWGGGNGREKKMYADLKVARTEAALKAGN